jgi:putative ABC transport system substrate-binding protein
VPGRSRSAYPPVQNDSGLSQGPGLVSYGTDRVEMYRRAASYADRILRGEKAGDLPFQLPTKYDLVINVKTARALGLKIPPNLLFTADEVIE